MNNQVDSIELLSSVEDFSRRTSQCLICIVHFLLDQRETKDVRHEQQYPPREPEPSESTVHGKEVSDFAQTGLLVVLMFTLVLI